jgi:tetratricopeptide (TPR) repeat protein
VQREFALFYNARPGNEPLHVEWLRRYPKSRAAHLALANHYEARGFAARGVDFAGKTSQEQFGAMEQLLRQALSEFDAADALGPKTSLAAAHRISIARTSRVFGLDASRLYRDVIKSYPNTLQARIEFIQASAPKWGGSIRQLLSIIDDAKPLGAADKRYVEYLVYEEIGNTYACTTDLTPECGTGKQAAEFYEKSIPLCPGLTNALRLAVVQYTRMKDIPNVMRTSSLLLEREPRNGWARAQRARGYVISGKYKEAFDDYRAGADLGSAEAFDGLAWLYEWGRGVPQDLHKSIDLYMTAANLGMDGARERADKVRAGTGLK